eukprot:sb/3478746/
MGITYRKNYLWPPLRLPAQFDSRSSLARRGKHECCDHDPDQRHQWLRKSIQRRVKKRKAGSCSGTSKQPIRTRYLGHVTGYHPIRDQYFLIQSGPMVML